MVLGLGVWAYGFGCTALGAGLGFGRMAFGRMVWGEWFCAHGFVRMDLRVWFGFERKVLSVWFWAYGFGRMVLGV